MSATTPATIPQAPIEEKKGRISKRLREVIRLVTSGECKTVKAASVRAGMNPQYLSGALKRPEVRVFMERCERESIAAGTMRACARLVELVDANSEHVAFDAARHLAAIQGIKPAADAQVSVNIDIKAGYVIDISPVERAMRDVTPRDTDATCN